MTDAFFERLRNDLGHKYELLGEIRSGGMGTVYLARDTHLLRPVAIKVIQQGKEGGIQVERFRLEAQSLAKVQHNNVVTVYEADETKTGILYFAMAYVEGETFDAELDRARPLPHERVVEIAVPLLSALETVHQAGIVHRDIKPSNILLAKDDGRPILIDFGIAKSDRGTAESTVASDTLTGPDDRLGTPRYMAPEQNEGGEVGPWTDLYSLGAVLYEAATPAPTKWPERGTAKAKWSSVPPALCPIIQRAVEPEPKDRWGSAREFAEELKASLPSLPPTLPEGSPRRQRATSGRKWLGGVALGAIPICYLVWAFFTHHPPFSVRPVTPSLALLPFMPSPGTDSSRASDLAWQVGQRLEDLGQRLDTVQVLLADPLRSFRCAQTSRETPNTGPWRAECGNPARLRVEGTVGWLADSVHVQVRLFDRKEKLDTTLTFAEPADSLQLLEDRIALAIGHTVDAQIPVPLPGHRPNLLAAAESQRGEAAFVANKWVEADGHYDNALRLDTTFASAAWRLAVVRAWMRVPVRIDLRRVYERYGSQLSPSVRLQLLATLQPIGTERVALLDSAARLSPFDASARLQYGDELWGRGPLVGIPLDSAAKVLDSATRLAPRMLPAYADLIWIYVRLGRQALAKRALDTLIATAPPPEVTGIDIPGLFRIIYSSRFPSDSTPTARIDTAGLMRSMRFGLALDIPETQLRYGRLFGALPGQYGANGHETAALALVALGRGREALAQFDTAAERFGTPTSRVEAAEWRAMPGAIGWSLIPPAEAARGEAELERWTRDPGVDARASADLAGIALLRGDRVRAARWRTRVESRVATDSDGRQALTFLRALELAQRGDRSGALGLSEPLLTARPQSRTRYPFLRSMLHVARARWFAQLDSLERADHEWLWYENNDATEWPSGPAQAGDVDWALTNYARLNRTLIAFRKRGGKAVLAEFCDQLRRVAELWAGANDSSRALLDSTRRSAPACAR